VINLIVCADDFGRSPAIDDAILELGHNGRVTATSVMVGEPNLWRSAAALKRVRGLEIGLHVVLSDDMPMRERAVSNGDFEPCHIDALTRQAFLGRLPLGAIAREVIGQFVEFYRIFGHPPRFVDGHQHCHILPGIRDIVLRTAARMAPGCWVRSCEQPLATIVQRGGDRGRALRSSLLSRGMRASVRAFGLRTNDGFAGLYDLGYRRGFPYRFTRFLDNAIAPNHLVICHPAFEDDDADPIGATRYAEYYFLRHAPIERMAADRGLSVGMFR
jgi:predicted glycoside hydrolase/deacetylase ChbG (UPF0249 family)